MRFNTVRFSSINQVIFFLALIVALTKAEPQSVDFDNEMSASESFVRGILIFLCIFSTK